MVRSSVIVVSDDQLLIHGERLHCESDDAG